MEQTVNIGDIVVYNGYVSDRDPMDTWALRKSDATEYIVTGISTDPTSGADGQVRVYEVDNDLQEASWRQDYFYASPNSLKVVRRASYTTVE